MAELRAELAEGMHAVADTAPSFVGDLLHAMADQYAKPSFFDDLLDQRDSGTYQG